MTQNRITMTEKGRTYTVTGDQVGTALACFTGLSILRSVLGFIGVLCGAGTAGALLKHFLNL